MRRTLIGVAVALGLGLASARAAEARDMNGRLGIGGHKTLAGVRGLDILYWIGPIALDGTINLYYWAPEAGDKKLKIFIAAGAFFPFLRGEHAELSIGGRVNIGAAHDTEIALEAPLRLSWYVTSHLAFHGEVGIVIALQPEEGDVLMPQGGSVSSNKGTGFLVGNTGLSGGAGFTFIF